LLYKSIAFISIGWEELKLYSFVLSLLYILYNTLLMDY
jgi:hypothetical protein